MYIYTGSYSVQNQADQTKTETLRNKQGFIECFYLEGAVFVILGLFISSK